MAIMFGSSFLVTALRILSGATDRRTLMKLEAKGIAGQVSVDDDWVTIERRGARAALRFGASGTKRIPINSITAVQFKMPS